MILIKKISCIVCQHSFSKSGWHNHLQKKDHHYESEIDLKIKLADRGVAQRWFKPVQMQSTQTNLGIHDLGIVIR